MGLNPQYLYNQARSYHQGGQIEQAIPLYLQLLDTQPTHDHARYLLGVSLIGTGDVTLAVSYLKSHLKGRPDHAPAWAALGEALSQLKRHEEAAGAFREAMRWDPKHLEAGLGLGKILATEGKWRELEAFSESLYRVHPGSVEAFGFWIRALSENGRKLSALKACCRFQIANGLAPEVMKWSENLFKDIQSPDTEVLNLLRLLDSARGQVLCFRAAVSARRKIRVLEALERIREEDPEGSILSSEDAADILHKGKFYKMAEELYWPLLVEEPNRMDLLRKLVENTLGRVRDEDGEKHLEAKEMCEYLVQKVPGNPDALASMAQVYMSASRPEMAFPFYDALAKSHPDHPLISAFLFNQNYDENRSPGEIYANHLTWAKSFERRNRAHPIEGRGYDPEKPVLRVGYVSPDLGNHPVGYFFKPVLFGHHPENVEVFLYSNRYEEKGDDDLSKAFREHVGEGFWRWTRGWSTERLREQIRRDRIDILVDLAGHTGHNRLDVFASRAAPVQVSWLGYANTTGLSQMDYRFSDAIVEPKGEADERSSETIYRLPNGFHTFGLPKELPPVEDAPCRKRGWITFGSYNNMNKLGSRSIQLWARLLNRVPHSRLLLKHKTLGVLNNRETIRSLFAMHGIQSHRVELLETTRGHAQHLASYREIDIALDPLAYNGTTTTCDSLLMGVPVLTLPGASHASRVTASLLHRIGLDAWAAPDEDAFLSIGLRVAQNPGILSSLRSQLRERFLESPLNDGAGLARELEKAYREMWRTFCKKQNAPRSNEPKMVRLDDQLISQLS